MYSQIPDASGWGQNRAISLLIKWLFLVNRPVVKILLLLLIKAYWAMIPRAKRRSCIFKISCSQYVYQKTTKYGLYEGLRAFRYRFYNCRSGFHVFEHPSELTTLMILRNGEIISQNEISERFIKNEQ
ncbi:membrane protein insertion efficiency factor YidD [Pedobacter sp. MC2016-14]|uniref:membrane protein insertion efficiency factor YidD n=1 Tax=Pedobacter sp. MC2016-14 TaxID=2897327 RepID=UPI00351D9C6D